MVKDYEQAMRDMEAAMKESVQQGGGGAAEAAWWLWLERGILEGVIMAKYSEALTDLDKAVGLKAGNYDALRHRGYVKYKMGDARGAKEDADAASKVRFLQERKDIVGFRSITVQY